MNILKNIAIQLLLEQENSVDVIKKAITEKIPVTINYSGPSPEVKSGRRIDILPIVMGKKKDSGNLVIWAFVFKGVSKKGIPNWKMFRIDRILSASLNPKGNHFDLDKIPGYIKGKAPSAMRSLSSVDVYSPWVEEKPQEIPKDTEKEKTSISTQPQIPSEPIPGATEPSEPEIQPSTGPVTKPGVASKKHIPHIFNTLSSTAQDINGQKVVTIQNYQKALDDLYRAKQDEFNVYQRMISGNVKPGEGTRARFRREAQSEIDKLMKQNNIKLSDETETLAEAYRIKTRFKRLII